MARSFGLILANRAVVLGAVKVPDLVDLTVQAERSGLFVVSGPRANAFLFGDGNLDVIDVLLIEERLENAVGESEDEDVLNRFLAQVMVDAINLVRPQRVQ